MATTAYQAGFESNAVELSYGLEAVWGVAPATTFQAIRSTGESLSGKKQRTRPDELNTTAQVSAAVTQQVSADGSINFALSYGTYDDLFCSLLNSAWAGTLSITGASGDISFAASGNTVSSTTSGKFTSVVLGQWVKIASPLNNGYGRVATKADNQTFTVAGVTLVNETPTGSGATIKSSGYIRNSNVFQSLFFQKKFSSSVFLTYPGTQVTGCTINANQGQFAEGNFALMSKIENKATTDSSTGGVLAAPTGNVFDTVAEFAQLQMDGATIAAVCKGVSLQMSKQGAAMDYGLASASAQSTCGPAISSTSRRPPTPSGLNTLWRAAPCRRVFRRSR